MVDAKHQRHGNMEQSPAPRQGILYERPRPRPIPLYLPYALPHPLLLSSLQSTRGETKDWVVMKRQVTL